MTVATSSEVKMQFLFSFHVKYHPMQCQ